MDAVLGGLIGSLATIAITKLLELLQKSKEHKYSLQKAFFVKKLETAEVAVRQWYVLSTSIGGLAKMYERAPVDEVGYDPEVFNAMHLKLTELVNQVDLSANSVANSFLLYFDMDEESLWDMNSLDKYFEKLSDIVTSANELRYYEELVPSIVGTEHEAIVNQRIIEISKNLGPELVALAGIMREMQQGVIDLLSKVRKEMSKYDS